MSLPMASSIAKTTLRAKHAEFFFAAVRPSLKVDSMNAPLTAKDFETDQEVRWCPGCGDYAILKAVPKTIADIGAGAKTKRYRLLP